MDSEVVNEKGRKLTSKTCLLSQILEVFADLKLSKTLSHWFLSIGASIYSSPWPTTLIHTLISQLEEAITILIQNQSALISAQSSPHSKLDEVISRLTSTKRKYVFYIGFLRLSTSVINWC